jgi:hypothetical protein
MLERLFHAEAVAPITKPGKTEREEVTLAQTGIRILRSQALFTTPNVFPPAEFEQRDV